MPFGGQQLLHRLQRQVLGLRQVEVEQEAAHQGDPTVAEEGGGLPQAGDERQEGGGDQEVGQPVVGGGEGDAGGPAPGRVQLRIDGPPQAPVLIKFLRSNIVMTVY